MKHTSQKYYTPDEALAKAQRYCAYQERCHSELRSKLIEWGVYGDVLEAILAELVTEGFLNEERYACTFARGKFRIKNWGRNRITQELRQRKVSDYCIRKAMQEIPEEEYRETLIAVLQRKAAEIAGLDSYEQKARLLRYALQRGFEQELVWEVLPSLDMGGD
ncbi:MAG: RecX family transcriptional regulator [Saprospiraceae bacterium]|nr:RecX family transcriptional regulator [Saprospiraceae bacterium]